MTVRETFEQVRAEGGEATPPAVEGATPAPTAEAPAVLEQAPVPSPEQPSADEGGTFEPADFEKADELLIPSDEDNQNGSEAGGITPGSDEFWALPVEVKTAEGSRQVPIREAVDGYMRQADYTQKTQGLAERTKTLERAAKFLDAFETDPEGFSRSLAVQAGLIAAGDAPVKQFEGVKIPTQDDLDQMITERTEARIKEDPRVKDAEVANARMEIGGIFDDLQSKYGIPLSEKVRASIIEEASRRQTSDLEGILAKRMLDAQNRESRKASVEGASPSRPSSAPPTGGGPPAAPESVRDAWAQVKAEQQNQ